jgi:type I restriction enzyme S subunit
MKKGWQTKKLGEVCSFLNRGVSPKYVEKGGIAVLNQRCVRDHVVSFEIGRRHDVKAKSVSNERLLQAGDVLVNSTGTGTLGRIAQLRETPPEPTTVDSHVTIVRPSAGLFFPEFFGYVLRDIEEELKESGEGCGGQTELNRSVLAEKFVIRFPQSLAEQQRIVGLLDEAFEGLATAKANAEKNLQNARALFESHLQSVFTQRGPGWVEKNKPLSELCELIVDCEHKTAPIKEEGFPSIRTPNIGKGKLLLDGVNRVSEETYKAWTRRAEPLAGDLILAREAPAGNVAVIPKNTRVCLGQRTVLIRPKPDIFDPSFLALRLLEPQMQEKLLAHSRGATVQHVNMKDIRALDVGAIPPLPVQQQIAANVNAVSAEGERLAHLYERKLAALEALKKSLLHQAFTGELLA